MSAKSITLSYPWFVPNDNMPRGPVIGMPAKYKVEKIVNCVDYKPGDLMLEKDVKNLCIKANWTVNMVEKKG